MHVLVVGFSVTAEKSFVERCQERLSPQAGIRLSKVGIGGWFPFLLRHVIDEILEHNRPDHVVFEIATPSLRSQNRSQEDHLESLRCLVASAVKHGVGRISFLDLPRSDVEEATDWQWAMHRAFCEEYALGYRAVPLAEGMLRDVVHPTAEGVRVFADALMALIETTPPLSTTARDRLAELRNPYSSIPAYHYGRGSAGLRDYARGGYGVTAVSIPAGETVRFDFGREPVRVLGYSMIMGPRSGALDLSTGDFAHRAGGYDPFCYYERIGATFFREQSCRRLDIRQDPALPGAKLLKGTPDTGPRLGHLCSIFIAGDSAPAPTVTAPAAPISAPPPSTLNALPAAVPAIPAERQHVLTVGFSVTDQHSFVEFARQRCARSGRSRIRFDKVGIGAWTPFQLRHVIDQILDLHQGANHLILEIATSQMRGTNRPRTDHRATLEALCAKAVARGVTRISLLDLPRIEVVEAEDWLWKMHRSFAAEHGLGYASVPLGKGMLTDDVHPTEAGKEIYTDAFMTLLDQPEIPPAQRDKLRNAPAPWACIPAPDCASGAPETKVYGRGGFRQTLVSIPGGAVQRFAFERPVQVVGYTMLRGPTTGALTLTAGTFTDRNTGYDNRCYYERLGVTLFEPQTVSELTIRQEPEVPEIALFKGDKDHGPRTGHIGAILTFEPEARPPDVGAPQAGKAGAVSAPAQPAAPLPALTGRARATRLIHLHQPRTAGRSLRQAIAAHLAPGRLELYQPGAPETVREMLERDAWRVFSGNFQALHGTLAAPLLQLPCWMTVVRDPAERLVSFLHYARAVPALGAVHDRLRPLGLEAGLALLIAENSSYAQSSQCRGIVWGEEPPTAEGALRVIARRFRLICTMEQLAQGFEALRRWELVAPDAVLPHVFAGPAHDAYLLEQARALLGDKAAEDALLHQQLLREGPVIREPSCAS
ncbi:SGNH/GDSL hydrolase family protein [Rhodobacter maris]|uniref:Lysophospholipase L1-like esterase n=1 Tax=Rhodobacter maris TaxID=446682 RepID=A0A285SGS4_9RHOB|nr:SGNH/GDSL hydrolase family protein [Rhodobacter maris]SOC06875.1 hypothetical protein SAMN05877831_105168 [Rhodobacter maris]